MNDRFKFRFYHYETEKEYEVKAICFEGRPIVTVQYNPVLKFPLDSGELIQCTGLRDKNGKLIYEGDLVWYKVGHCGSPRHITGEYIQKVEYYKGCFIPIYQSEIVEIEVVGNIHENMEFLK